MRSNLNGDEQKTWHNWFINPRGGDEHLTSAGSRARPKNIGTGRSTVDELYERMVKRGVVSRERKAR